MHDKRQKKAKKKAASLKNDEDFLVDIYSLSLLTS